MDQLPVWVGAGLVTAGVSAALLAGASVAGADTGSGSESGGATSSGSTRSESTKPDPGADAKDRQSPTAPKSGSEPASGAGKPDAHESGSKKDEDDKDKEDADHESAIEAESAPNADDQPPSGEASEPVDEARSDPSASDPVRPAATPPKSKPTPQTITEKLSETGKPAPTEPSPADEEDSSALNGQVTEFLTTEPTETRVEDTSIASMTNRVAIQSFSMKSSAPAANLVQAQMSANITPQVPPALNVIGVIGSLISAVVVNVGSLVFNVLQAVEALVTGPPVLPPNSTVTVRSSTIQLSNGQRVAANWYYPEVPEGGKPPTQMILLQHGFLALGPMYSYTAANLAEETHSIVVTPTLSSNPFAGDDYWLGGTGMSRAIADLFVGDRAALTRSALDADYATAYGLDPDTAQLPTKFGLAGHSLGANLVSGAAGFLAENPAKNPAADNLVGVILLDGVPTGSTLPDALDKLKIYEGNGGHYIPIREIGAPWNLFNFISTVNETLSTKRAERFNGVVLTGGVHMDSMRGGNPLIQFAAYLVAGFPQPQNPPAVDKLAVTWFGEWFLGDISKGDGLIPGSTIPIVTPQGTAHGVVIGTPLAGVGPKSLQGAVAVEPSSPSTIPEVNPTLAGIAA